MTLIKLTLCLFIIQGNAALVNLVSTVGSASPLLSCNILQTCSRTLKHGCESALSLFLLTALFEVCHKVSLLLLRIMPQYTVYFNFQQHKQLQTSMKVHLQSICRSVWSLCYFMPDKVDLYYAFIIPRYRSVLITFLYHEKAKSIISQCLRIFKGAENFALVFFKNVFLHYLYILFAQGWVMLLRSKIRFHCWTSVVLVVSE